MSYFSNLSVEIIDLYLNGHRPKYIAKKLNLPIEDVLLIIKSFKESEK